MKTTVTKQFPTGYTGIDYRRLGHDLPITHFKETTKTVTGFLFSRKVVTTAKIRYAIMASERREYGSRDLNEDDFWIVLLEFDTYNEARLVANEILENKRLTETVLESLKS